MMKRILITALIIGLAVTVGDAINRSVYKVLLEQKGYAQFLQYDVETPPLQEFTFCTWLLLNDFSDEQTIFTYGVNGKKHVILWLPSGGTKLKIAIAQRSFTSVPINLTKNSWSHVCLSYQSDFGAVALYLDSRIVTCEAKRALEGLILPGGGSITVGYGGTHYDTRASGLKGEIYGVNMILLSTIEKNQTTEKMLKHSQQKSLPKTKLKGNENKTPHIIFDELASNNDDQTHPILLRSTRRPPIQISTSISNKVHDTSPYSAYRFLDHDLGIDISSMRPISKQKSKEIEIVDYIHQNEGTKIHAGKKKMNFWDVVNKAGQEGKFNTRPSQNTDTGKIPEIFSSGTQDLPTVSIYETPPLPGPPNQEFYEKGLEMVQPPSEPTHINIEQNEEIIDMEPPPPTQKNAEVFGQWSGSKFAGSVLNYLKNINFRYQKSKKIPNTIPLTRLSDSLPYASNSKMSHQIIAPPKLQRRKFVDQGFNIIKKRQLTNAKVINVQILEDNLRESIFRSHAEIKPIKVEITNRGLNIKYMDHRRYRNIDRDSEDIPKISEGNAPTLNLSNSLRNHKMTNDTDIYNTNMPVEYAEDEIQQSESETDPKQHQSSDLYKNIMANGNEWHNIKPRRIIMRPHKAGIHNFIKSQKKNNENRRYMYDTEREKYIEYGRELIKNLSRINNEKEISVLKYNKGYLPVRLQQLTVTEETHGLPFKNKNQENAEDSFHKPVKIGNALNEIHLVGSDGKHKMKSFVGGDDNVPDINQYRSDIEPEHNADVPPSLRLRTCTQDNNNNDHRLFVQADGSVSKTDKLSPIVFKNKAIEFIMTNYKICSLELFILNESSLLLINWNKTPVRLFGGAIPKETKDLCGFF